MVRVEVKKEIEVLNTNINDYTRPTKPNYNSTASVIDLDSSDDDSSSSGSGTSNGKRSRVLSDIDEALRNKQRRSDGDDVALPLGFLDPLPPKDVQHARVNQNHPPKQFWKAGDFEGESGGDWGTSSGGIDHLRVHPRFLHSNATSHKWVLGAFAELLDNALDEVCNGATYVSVDMVTNKKDKNRMLLIEDNGGGMDPDKMRQCMSLGYSLKSKVKDVIGQYGNGFKTSTMRLGADVIVFSRSSGHGKRSTQSIGLLSYTFLRSTGKEDIVVPMLDYERGGKEWKKMKRLSPGDWDKNVDAIVQWSPFSSETELLKEFDDMKDHGTRIIIYNLWEDDQGSLELDFDADEHDIQIRGANRDEIKIEMAQQYPNSRHFLTYRHSLRSYASILYLRVPHTFRMILRGKDVEHHNIVNDMMMTNEVTYRPAGVDGVPKDSNMVAVVTMGFVKDAKAHIDVQGFNVYHKNRLIKPFWRLWNAAGSDGRGVIGVLEANFVEPAHDKQGFERTTVLSRLETRLIQMQKTYWQNNCHYIGYAPRGKNRKMDDRELSPDNTPELTRSKRSAGPTPDSDKVASAGPTYQRPIRHPTPPPPAAAADAHVNGNGEKSQRVSSSSESTTPFYQNTLHDYNHDDMQTPVRKDAIGSSQKGFSAQKTYFRDRSVNDIEKDCSPSRKAVQVVTDHQLRVQDINGNETISLSLERLMEENRELKERIRRREEEVLGNLVQDLEGERNHRKTLEAQVEEEKQKTELLSREQESIIAIFTEERERRDVEETTLKKKLKDAEVTGKKLEEKVRQLQLEKMRIMGSKWEQE